MTTNINTGHASRRAKSSRLRQDPRPPVHPVDVRTPLRVIWDTARELAGDEVRRLEVLPDGSVIVHNQPIRRKK